MEVNIHKLQDGKFQTSYTDPVLNRRVRSKFKHYNKAKEFQKNILNEHWNENFIARSSAPLGDFLPGYRAKYPEASLFKRSPLIYKSFVTSFATMPINEVTKLHLGNWLERVEKENDYAASTMVLLKYCITPFFDYLRGLGVIRKNPMAEVKISRAGVRRRERVQFSESETKEVIERFKAASPTEIYPVSYFQLHTAAHIGETLKLKWQDVDEEQGAVHFPESGSAADRTMTIPPKLIEVLKALPRINEFVFNRDDGEHWSVVSFYRKFSKLRDKLAFKKKFDSSVFRHTYAYHYLRKGGSLAHLQALLGHRGIDMTVAMYGSIVPKATEKLTPYDF